MAKLPPTESMRGHGQKHQLPRAPRPSDRFRNAVAPPQPEGTRLGRFWSFLKRHKVWGLAGGVGLASAGIGAGLADHRQDYTTDQALNYKLPNDGLAIVKPGQDIAMIKPHPKKDGMHILKEAEGQYCTGAMSVDHGNMAFVTLFSQEGRKLHTRLFGEVVARNETCMPVADALLDRDKGEIITNLRKTLARGKQDAQALGPDPSPSR